MEDKIMACWGILEDIDTIQRSDTLDSSDMGVALEALRVLYDLKFQELWSEFERGLAAKKNAS